jgi:hypothetical protein
MSTRLSLLAAVAATTLLAARPALAGPPLICFPFDIQGARTLPMGAEGWHQTDPGYDVSKLVADTLDLLTPDAPVIVRMETLRRATIYAASHPLSQAAGSHPAQVSQAAGSHPAQALGASLLEALQERVRTAPSKTAALARFDLGYLVETYRQGAMAFKGGTLPAVDAIDGYQMVLDALALRPDPQMEFAAAIMTAGGPRKADHPDHVRRVLSAAKQDQLIAANAASHGLGHE